MKRTFRELENSHDEDLYHVAVEGAQIRPLFDVALVKGFSKKFI